MTNQDNTSNKTKFYIILFAVFFILTALMVWKFQDKLGLKIRKINLTAVMPERYTTKPENIYESHSVSSVEATGGVYYTKLTNVICDAAPRNDGKKSYIRISMTFESSDKKNAEKLSQNSSTLVADLRSTVSNLRMGDANQAKLMDYIKTNMNNKIKQKFGDEAVKNIYFEEILSQ